MSQNPNDNAANGANNPANFPPGKLPSYPGSPTTEPAAGGLKSSLKVAVPLVALVGVVFGVTYLGMYTPPKTDDDPNKTKTQGGTGEPPLRFFTSARRWDPPMLSAPGYRHLPLLAPSKVGPSDGDPTASFSLQDRIFQGFYEHGDTQRRTAFWFENRNDRPVTLRLQKVSCTACSGARLAAIPPETTKQLLHHAAIASLPLGPFNGFGVGLSQPGAALFGMTEPHAGLTPLQWQAAEFKDDPNAAYQVPAATNLDKWSAQWGILELTFKVQEHPSLPLRALFSAQIDGTTDAQEAPFVLWFEVASGFEVSRTAITASEVTQLTGDSEYELLIYSSTRGPGSEFGDLLPPTLSVQLPPGITEAAKFVDVTKVERVPEAELMDVTERLFKDNSRLANVRAAYRATIALRPKIGELRLDLGQLERIISVSVPGASTSRQVTFKALVRGSVWVEGNRSEIVVNSFRGATGTTESLNLATAKTGMELTVVKELCEFKDEKPAQGVTFELEKQPDRGGEGRYRLKITIPPGKAFGDFTGVIVLEVKAEKPGQPPQRIRIPYKGTSRL